MLKLYSMAAINPGGMVSLDTMGLIGRTYVGDQKTLLNILNKSENATPELFAIYIQNYANQECK